MFLKQEKPEMMMIFKEKNFGLKGKFSKPLFLF